MLFPELLRPGDTVALVAPSSSFPSTEFFTGLEWLRQRYRIHITSDVLLRHGYLAGTDEDRVRSLSRAMTDPFVRAIVAARGGYGSMRILDALPWNEWCTRPSWLVGFSDITALHLEAHRRGVGTVHGPNVTSLGRAAPIDRYVWLRALESKEAAQVWSLRALRDGDAEGPLVGGNLSLVQAMLASGRCNIPRGAMLLLEDVTEAPYRVDRMLTSLLLAPAFRNVSCVIFGDFSRCDARSDGRTVLEVLADFAERVSVPVFVGAPVGHGDSNRAFRHGANARIKQRELFLGCS